MLKKTLKPIYRNSPEGIYFEISISYCKIIIEGVKEFPANIHVFDLPVLNSPIKLSVYIFGLLIVSIGFK